MICNDCTKKDVCKHTEQCQSLERNYAGVAVNSIFHITVSCDKRAVYPTLPRGGITSAPPGGVWVTERKTPMKNNW